MAMHKLTYRCRKSYWNARIKITLHESANSVIAINSKYQHFLQQFLQMCTMLCKYYQLRYMKKKWVPGVCKREMQIPNRNNNACLSNPNTEMNTFWIFIHKIIITPIAKRTAIKKHKETITRQSAPAQLFTAPPAINSIMDCPMKRQQP